MEPMIHGILLAFGLIIPLGVQNVFIFNQEATQPRFLTAVPAIVTAALCDTLLITLAVTGVSVVLVSFEEIRLVLFTVGFCFLLYMGLVMWRTKPSIDQEKKYLSIKKQISFAASVSLLNPHAILDTFGVIGTSSLLYVGVGKVTFALACITVSWLWFIGLAIIGRVIGSLSQSSNFLYRLNQVSAIIIWTVALYMGSKLIFK
ncbi:LysE/ArgO family amino acid transporter [Ornithinibacillus halotolerans]|uniref:Amino acid transporter n=1 Tax=Ornithinibacillus halotolerans TaxID=1274357 RepID=A0A916WCU0_9BACI|nr:LysE family transporter [Ornithinibacillus halotolerans]GGA86596.1 hypothetical protein GCM10008025_31840 [Ornithinibacillus halotolerans]